MIQRRRKSIRTESADGIGGHLLGLSLFVMMLAFFIVLNAISNFDEAKVEPMRQSLEDTFATKISTQNNMRTVNIQAEEQALAQGETLDRIKALFTSNITGTQTITSTERGTLYMRLPRGEFERIVASLGAGQKTDVARPLLETLISILRTDQRGAAYRVDITYNLDHNPGRVANREPQKMQEYITAAAAAAQTLEKSGMPARLLSVGLKKGNSDYVDLMFSPHLPFNPKGGADE